MSVKEVYSNLHSLYSEDQEVLISQTIKHRWRADGEEQCYFRAILDVVAGTDDWYNIQYDNEDHVLSLNLLLDIEQVDLEFVDWAFNVVFVHSVASYVILVCSSYKFWQIPVNQK